MSQLSPDKSTPFVSQAKVSGILLAAGEAHRMGRSKLLLPWGGGTIIENIVDSYLHTKISELIVVINPNNQQIRDVLMLKSVVIVENPHYKEGMSTSISHGVAKASVLADGYLIGLGDQPLITTDIIDSPIASFSQERLGIAVCAHKGERGHPVIFARKFRQALLTLRGDRGGRVIIKQHSDEIQYVEIGSETIFMDIDTPEDYQRIQKVNLQKSGNYL